MSVCEEETGLNAESDSGDRTRILQVFLEAGRALVIIPGILYGSHGLIHQHAYGRMFDKAVSGRNSAHTEM